MWNELKEYLLCLAKNYIVSGQSFAHPVYSFYSSIRKIIVNMGNTAPTTVQSLTLWNVCAAITKFNTDCRITPSTQRRILFDFRQFVAFAADANKALEVVPDCIIPDRCLNPTSPLDAMVAMGIERYKDELPKHISLAYRLLRETGSRIDSVSNSIENNLAKQKNGKWTMRLYYNKTANRDAKAHHPSYRIHELSNDLGKDLSEFIEETASLRAKCSAPYIFVYMKDGLRADSKRIPRVLNSESFCLALNDLCTRHHITDSQGMPAKCTPRNIRAEVGRGMLNQGHSFDQVAQKLGNTVVVVAMHYNKRYPADEAKKHRELYMQTLDEKIGIDLSLSTINTVTNTPMFGSCDNTSQCFNRNVCSECDLRIQCSNNNEKQKKGA